MCSHGKCRRNVGRHRRLLRVTSCIANLSKSKDNQHFGLPGHCKGLDHFDTMQSPAPEILRLLLLCILILSCLLLTTYGIIFQMSTRITHILACLLVLHSFLHLRPSIWVTFLLSEICYCILENCKHSPFWSDMSLFCPES